MGARLQRCVVMFAGRPFSCDGMPVDRPWWPIYKAYFRAKIRRFRYWPHNEIRGFLMVQEALAPGSAWLQPGELISWAVANDTGCAASRIHRYNRRFGDL